MPALPADQLALLFSTGGVRLALRLSQVREIVEVGPGDGDVRTRGEVVPSAYLSSVLGLPAGGARYALVTEATPRCALRVDALHGLADLAGAEAFNLPAHTLLPQPSPFAGALVVGGRVALELAVAALGFAPIEPAVELAGEPPSLGPWLERELRFSRGDLTFGVPLSLLGQVIESAELALVPLTPPSHRGLLYHGRALHPVVDVGVLYGLPATVHPRHLLLVDAGGAGVAVAADRILGVGMGATADDVLRPPWDALFGAG